MSHSSPRITIFIPTYNRAPLLRRAVASALAADPTAIVHVLNNASTDETHAWLESDAIRANPRLRVTHHRENIGSLNNFTTGFAMSDTEFVVPLADDDELIPGFLPRAVPIHEAHDRLACVVGHHRVPGRLGWTDVHFGSRTIGFTGGKDLIHDFLRHGHFVTWSAALWRTDCVAGGDLHAHASTFGLASDVYFQFHLFLRWNAYLLPLPAATFSVTPGQASSRVGLSVGSFRDFGRLVQTMQEQLCAAGFAAETADARRLLAPMVQRWSRFVADNRRMMSPSPDADNLRDCLAAFVSELGPYIDSACFPFTFELLDRRTPIRTMRRLLFS